MSTNHRFQPRAAPPARLERGLGAYLRPLDRGVAQTGRLEGGGAYSRGDEEIGRRRRSNVERLDRVKVLNHEVMYQGSGDRKATFGVRYGMDFHGRDGGVTRARNVNERCNVRELTGEARWVIVRNDDYPHRLCDR